MSRRSKPAQAEATGMPMQPQHHGSIDPPDGGARRRRPILITMAAFGGLVGILGGLGVFADAFDRATTGPNSIETDEFVELDLQLATYDSVATTCGTYVDDLATGLITVTAEEAGGVDGDTFVCLRNIGERTGTVSMGILDGSDTEIGCTGEEASVDQTCGTGAGELSSHASTGASAACDATSVIGRGFVDFESLSFSSAPLFDLGPGEERVICLQVDVSEDDASRRLIQTDRFEWRYAFDLAEFAVDPVCQDDAFEPDGSIAEARALDSAGAGSGVICGGDSDYFVYDHPGGTLQVDLTFDPTAGDLDLAVLDPNGSAGADSGSPDSTEHVTTTAAAGTYYVRVFGWEGGTYPNVRNSYDLLVQSTPAPACDRDSFEPNDSLDQAVLLPRNVDNQASRCGNDDFYLTSVSEASPGVPGHFSVTLTYDQGLGDLDLRVRDAAGTVIFTGNGTTGTETYTNSSYTGDMTVEVFGFQGADNPSYTLRVDVNT